ncbi:MAG: hypothetical protein Q8Q11_03270 [bacterium]|nr:hypothetical protein [bacterium]MDZ4247912.1 hypothetical protein [Patescibacteria group bacterium]
MSGKAIISSVTETYAPLLTYSRPTFERFAERHGYEVVIDRRKRDNAPDSPAKRRRARWRKIQLLEKALQQFGTVVWFDADVMITKFDRDILADIAGDCFQGLVLEVFPHRYNPNTGVWVLRQDRDSFRFLAKVRKLGQLNHGFADQGSVMKALGWELGNYKHHGAKISYPSQFLIRTSWLPPEWNPLGLASRWPSRTKHFANMKQTARITAMQAELQRLKKARWL